MSALGLFQGDRGFYESLRQQLGRFTFGWMQPGDYSELIKALAEKGASLSEPVVATHLALRHLHGEKLVSQEALFQVTNRARHRIRDYVALGRPEGEILEEPLVLAAFGTREDLPLMRAYLALSDKTFHFHLVSHIWDQFIPFHLKGSVRTLISRFRLIDEGTFRTTAEKLLGAMEARFE